MSRVGFSLGKILFLLLLIPLLLIGIILLGFVSFTGVSSTNVAYTGIENYADSAKIMAWIKDCDADGGDTYALSYCCKENDQFCNQFLIYRPSSETATIGSDSGLFGTKVIVDYHSNDPCETPLISISYYTDKEAKLKVTLDDKKINCPVTEVDFKLTLFDLVSD